MILVLQGRVAWPPDFSQNQTGIPWKMFVNWKYVAELLAFGHHRPAKNHSKRQVQILAENHTRHFTCFHPSRCPFQTYASRPCYVQYTRKENVITTTKFEPEGQPQTWTASRLNFHNMGSYFLHSTSIMGIPLGWTRQIQRGWRHTRQLETPGRLYRSGYENSTSSVTHRCRTES